MPIIEAILAAQSAGDRSKDSRSIGKDINMIVVYII